MPVDYELSFLRPRQKQLVQNIANKAIISIINETFIPLLHYQKVHEFAYDNLHDDSIV